MSATAAAPGPATTMAAGARPQPEYGRVAAFGLALLGAAPILMLVVGALSGMSLASEGPFFAVVAAVPLVAAGLAWRFGTWSKIVAIVAAAVAAVAVFWMTFGLAFPGSFGDFVPGVMFVLGLVLAVGGAIAAIVQGRRQHTAATPTRRERAIILVASAIVLLAVVVSGALTLLAGRSAATASGTEVTMADFSFAESTYTIAAGEPTQLVVHNGDGFMHDLTVPALGVDAVRVQPGADAVIEIPASTAGNYTVYCSLHSNTSEKDPQRAGMAATLIVE